MVSDWRRFIRGRLSVLKPKWERPSETARAEASAIVDVSNRSCTSAVPIEIIVSSGFFVPREAGPQRFFANLLFSLPCGGLAPTLLAEDAMNADDARRQETEALIHAIWGPAALDPPPSPDPLARERQNKALAAALKAYLQEYLVDDGRGVPSH